MIQEIFSLLDCLKKLFNQLGSDMNRQLFKFNFPAYLNLINRDKNNTPASSFYGFFLLRNLASCLNFWDKAYWFLSLRVFGLLSSSLLLFPQRFGRYILWCLSNSGTFTELRTTSFIESMEFVSKETIIWRLHVQSWLQASNNTGILNTCTRLWLLESEQATPVGSIKDVVRSSVKVPEFDKHLKKAGGHIGRNVVEIAIKMKTIVLKPLMTQSCCFIFYSWIE